MNYICIGASSNASNVWSWNNKGGGGVCLSSCTILIQNFDLRVCVILWLKVCGCESVFLSRMCVNRTVIEVTVFIPGRDLVKTWFESLHIGPCLGSVYFSWL